MYIEKVTFTKEEAQNIMKNYLEKVIDFVDGEINRCEGGAYLIDSSSYHGRNIKRFKELSTKSYFDILKLALEDAGYQVNFIKEVFYGEEIRYTCFFDLISKKGR